MKHTHHYVEVSSHGEDAPGKSLDTYEYCRMCGTLKHDFRHNGGQRSGLYPQFSCIGLRGWMSSEPPCATVVTTLPPEADLVGFLRECADDTDGRISPPLKEWAAMILRRLPKFPAANQSLRPPETDNAESAEDCRRMLRSCRDFLCAEGKGRGHDTESCGCAVCLTYRSLWDCVIKLRAEK